MENQSLEIAAAENICSHLNFPEISERNEQTILFTSFCFCRSVFLYSQGSVVVDFTATFDEEVSDDQALSVLKNVVKDGKLGSFNVDSTSVKSIAPTAQPESKEPTKGKYLSTRIEKKTVD